MERIDNDPTRAGGISTMTEVPTQKIPLKRRNLPKEEGKKLWKTLIVNNNPGLLIHLPTSQNYIQRWADIRPKEELQLEFDDTSYFLMPYKKIVYGHKDNNVSLQKRKGYVEEKHPGYSCTFLNRAGQHYLQVIPSEGMSSPIFLPKGIPIKRYFDIGSRWCEFESVVFEAPDLVEIVSLGRPGSTEIEMRPNIVTKRHPQKILAKIRAERKAAALKSSGLNK